jgi:beta-mannanase
MGPLCRFLAVLCACVLGACGTDHGKPAANGSGGNGTTTSGGGGQASGSGGAESSAMAGAASGGHGASTGSGGNAPSGSGGSTAQPTGSGGRDARDDAGTQPDAATSDAGNTSTDGGDPNILVPAHGALLGIFYGADDIAATSAKLGRSAAIHLTYYAWEDDWTGNITRADLAAGRIPLVNWEPYDTKLDDIIDGTYDARLHELASSARDLDGQFFFDFAAEMNGNWSPWSGADNGMSADKYIAAYRHLHDVFSGDGADNIVFAWCPNVTSEPRASWNDTLAYYPGDDYVDWTCVDGYNWGTTNGDGWQSFHDVFADVYATLATKHKPILIGEMASTEEGGDKAAWIDAMVPALQNDFPLIKALVWFDIDKETDWRISSSQASQAAFVRMANDPYMNP